MSIQRGAAAQTVLSTELPGISQTELTFEF